MRIDPGSTVGGQSAMEVRDFLRNQGAAFTAQDAAEAFGVPVSEATRLVAALKRRGYIAPEAEKDEGKTQWALTDAGRLFAQARANVALYRGKAAQLLHGFLDRVREVNANDYYLYRVKRALVFGSYLGAEERIGDINIAVELDCKLPKGKQAAAFRQRTQEAIDSGRWLRTIESRRTWPEKEVRLYLKSNSSYLNITDAEAIDAHGWPHVDLIRGGEPVPDAMEEADREWRAHQRLLTDAERRHLSQQLARRLDRGTAPDWAAVTRDELDVLVWTMPTDTLAAKFGVSDHSVKQKCQRWGIAKPSQRFWQNVKAGHLPAPQGVPVEENYTPADSTLGVDWATITKDDLERLVWQMPMTKLSRELGVSDSLISRRCKEFGIAKPDKGHWLAGVKHAPATETEPPAPKTGVPKGAAAKTASKGGIGKADAPKTAARKAAAPKAAPSKAITKKTVTRKAAVSKAAAPKRARKSPAR